MENKTCNKANDGSEDFVENLHKSDGLEGLSEVYFTFKSYVTEGGEHRHMDYWKNFCRYTEEKYPIRQPTSEELNARERIKEKENTVYEKRENCSKQEDREYCEELGRLRREEHEIAHNLINPEQRKKAAQLITEEQRAIEFMKTCAEEGLGVLAYQFFETKRNLRRYSYSPDINNQFWRTVEEQTPKLYPIRNPTEEELNEANRLEQRLKETNEQMMHEKQIFESKLPRELYGQQDRLWETYKDNNWYCRDLEDLLKGLESKIRKLPYNLILKEKPKSETERRKI